MIRLTNEEKANRYDALQIAIKYTLTHYKKERKINEEKYNNDNFGVIGAYHKGLVDGADCIIGQLEMWAE